MAIDVKVEIPVTVKVTGQFDRQNEIIRNKEVKLLEGKKEQTYGSSQFSKGTDDRIVIGDYTMNLQDLRDAIHYVTKDSKKPVYRDSGVTLRD